MKNEKISFLRIFDFIVALTLLILLSPLLLATTIAIFLVLGKPVLFTQSRPGYKGRPFKIYKFRTMHLAYDASGNLLPDHQRFTKLGNFLRKYSIDELPQLWNIVKGELSLVGPRPLLLEYLPLYNEEQKRRHDVRPGVTGLAQVNGRNAISWEEKFKLDIYYVDNQSFWLNLKILFLTFLRVINPQGINKEENLTMEPFRGNEGSNHLKKN